MAIDLNKTMRPAEIDLANKINAIGTKLYDGTISSSSGSVTVDNLSNYSFFVCYLSGENVPIFVFSPPGAITFRGSGGFITNTPRGYIYSVGLNRSGNALTYSYAALQRIDNHAITQKDVSVIYGII